MARAGDGSSPPPTRPPGKRRFYSRNGFPTKKAAQEALSAELARFHNGAFVEPSKLTVEAFLLEQVVPSGRGTPAPLHPRQLRDHPEGPHNPGPGAP